MDMVAAAKGGGGNGSDPPLLSEAKCAPPAGQVSACLLLDSTWCGGLV